MIKVKLIATILATILASILFSPVLQASGGGGFDQKGGSQRKIDQQYELGKSYYKARQADGSRLEYCVKTGDKLQKLSRKSVKQFKGGSAEDFTNSLYSCSDSSLPIADIVANDKADAILYYLNKRFKLRLS